MGYRWSQVHSVSYPRSSARMPASSSAGHSVYWFQHSAPILTSLMLPLPLRGGSPPWPVPEDPVDPADHREHRSHVSCARRPTGMRVGCRFRTSTRDTLRTPPPNKTLPPKPRSSRVPSPVKRSRKDRTHWMTPDGLGMD